MACIEGWWRWRGLVVLRRGAKKAEQWGWLNEESINGGGVFRGTQGRRRTIARDGELYEGGREEGRKPGGWCRYKLGPLGCVVPSVLAPRFPQWVALQPRHQEMPTARRGCGAVQRRPVARQGQVLGQVWVWEARNLSKALRLLPRFLGWKDDVTTMRVGEDCR